MRSRLAVFLVPALAAASHASAQISLTSAVDLALKSNPRVRMAEADVNKSAAVLAQAKDAYIPSLTAGSGLGYSYGYPLGQPSVVNATVQSAVLNWSQRDYIRAAHDGMQAAAFSLQAARADVEQDTVLAFLTLSRDLQREQALGDELTQAEQLVSITSDRLNAGVDNAMDLTQAKLTAAQIRLARLHAQDDTAVDRTKLAHLMGLPPAGLTTVADSVPVLADPAAAAAPLDLPDSPSVRAAFANAHAKLETAWGDHKRLYRPDIYLAGQYSLFAKFNNYQVYFPTVNGKSVFQYNNAGIGVQINWPIFDRSRKDHAAETAADAVRAAAEADLARLNEQDGHAQLTRSTAELSAKAEVATLQQQLAQQQLDVIHTQLQAEAATTGAQQRTPKDQANAAIDERRKFVDLIDARFELQQAQVQLLHAQGTLDTWLRHAAATPSTP